MKKLLLPLIALLLATSSCLAAGTGQPTLSLGLFPYLNARQLVSTYQPLRAFLEQQLGRPVMLYTAPDFSNFVSRTQGGEYDVILTAPHFARLAQIDGGYRPMFAFRNEINADIVVPGNSPRDFTTLRGAKIIAPDGIALVTMLGVKMLRDHGLETGRDYTLLETATHGNVALAVAQGEAQAGIMSARVLKTLPESTSNQLHVLEQSPTVPAMMLLAHPRLTAKQVQLIKDALLQFEQSPTGQVFFQSTGLAGFKPANADDLKQLDPYAREVKRMLERPN